MKKLLFGPCLVLLMVFTQSCFHLNDIEGNYNLVTTTRSVGSFTGVESCGDLQVKIVSDSTWFVEIEGEENLIPYIETDVNNGILRIETQHRRNLDPNYPIIIYVHTPTLASVELSGSGSISSDTLNTPNLDIRLSGSGNINLPVVATDVDATISGSGDIFLSGSSVSADFEISGSGDIHAYTFPVSECMADISGSGSMYVNVSDLLDVVISGSGNVHYQGNPIVSVSIIGSGQVIHQ